MAFAAILTVGAAAVTLLSLLGFFALRRNRRADRACFYRYFIELTTLFHGPIRLQLAVISNIFQ
jgi:hypothetical protein